MSLLLFSPTPVQAQAGGTWVALDQNDYPYNSGGPYPLWATPSIVAQCSGNYSAITAYDWTNHSINWLPSAPRPGDFFLTFPPYVLVAPINQFYPSQTHPSGLGVSTRASNCAQPQYSTIYTFAGSPLTGNVSSAGGGILTLKFKYSPPTTGTVPPVPTYLDVMVTTTLHADATANYFSTGLTSGLSASASVANLTPGFGTEGVSALAGDGSPLNGIATSVTPADVVGRHLVRVPVIGGIAKLVLTGQISGACGNSIANSLGNLTTTTFANAGFNATAALAGPPKSIMINGPVRTTQVYDGSQWRGTGDSVFTTQKILPLPTLNPITVGADYGPLSWTAGLLGSPWPTNSDWHYPQSSPIPNQTSAFDRQWAWNSAPQADGDKTFNIRTFQTARPNVDWPWDSSTKYLPNDFLEFCSNGPAPIQKHIWLQLVDTDTYGNHPEWSFANTANYYITFHNEAESPSNIVATTTPLTDNSWKLYTGPGSAALSQVGIAPNLDSKGAPIQGTGTYPWSPGSASVYTEYNWGGSYDIPITGIGANGGVNRGQQVSQNVPSQVIQPGQRGMVYWRAPTNRSLFNFRHYSVGGEDITYDANGNVVPHRGFADRPVGGTGTSSADFIVWVKPVNFNFPPTTTLDLAGAK